MKKLIWLICLVLMIIGVAACNKKEDSFVPITPEPAPVISALGKLRFTGNINGGSQEWMPHIDPRITVGDYDYTASGDSGQTKFVYGIGIGEKSGENSIYAMRGYFINMWGANQPKNMIFSIFKRGTYNYRRNETEVVYRDFSFREWNSWKGTQDGSKFTIEDAQLEIKSGDTTIRVAISFNCKLYLDTDPTQSITITDGVLVSSFSR